MIPKDLFEKVRRIEITTSRLVNDIFAGQYHSVFKGRGMEFDEVREYQMGDDIRTIDWNVTARTGIPHIKKFVEERELTVMILVDASRSCQFASVNRLKSKLAAEIAAVLAFSAIRNNDKIGLIIFTDQIETFIPARKGLRHVLRVIREVLYFNPKSKQTNLAIPLEYLNQVTTRKTVSFMISDFFVSDQRGLPHSSAGQYKTLDGLKRVMAIANKRHDLVAITLNDPKEMELPDCGLLDLEDAESGTVILVDTSNKEIRERYKQKALARYKARDLLFRSIGVDHIDISTDVPYADAMVKFFMQRRKRLR